MFADDIALVAEMVAKYGATGPFVDVGGLERPCVADYQRTIEAMKTANSRDAIIAAQHVRYLDVFRPLEASCPNYVCENPETGGTPVELLERKYGTGTGRTMPPIGTAILLSVLEHVDDPFWAINQLGFAMAKGGLVIVSVPFNFPYHPSPEDHWRFTPTGLIKLFDGSGCGYYPDGINEWEVLEADWRLDIPAEAGVIDLKTGRAQIIKSAFLVARAT